MSERPSLWEFLRRRRGKRVAPIECDGGPYCQAWTHIHGCLADKGDCDHPDEHRLAANRGGDRMDTWADVG